MAAVERLNAVANDQVGTIVLAGWSGYSPDVRNQALDLLLSRPAWRGHLLEAIDKKQVPAGDVDAKRREVLLEVRDKAQKALAVKVFSGAVRPDRQKVINEHADVIVMKSDAARGQAVFAKRCALCHKLGNVGVVVGPDLTSVSTKSPDYLLTELLDPSRNVDIRYHEYVAVTKSGRIVTGILSSESAASVTIRSQEGKEQTLLRTELEDLKSTEIADARGIGKGSHSPRSGGCHSVPAQSVRSRVVGRDSTCAQDLRPAPSTLESPDSGLPRIESWQH